MEKIIKDTDLAKAIRAFFGHHEELSWRVLGCGNINDTYLIRCPPGAYVLQRINDRVFPDPEKVAVNSLRVSNHIVRKTRDESASRFPEIILTLEGGQYHRDGNGSIWRAQTYLDNTRVYETIKNTGQAFEVGACLAGFHLAVEDLPADSVQEVLPGFHDLPLYLANFDTVLAAYSAKPGKMLKYCFDSVARNRKEADFFRQAVSENKLSLSVVHGDPKVDNVLFDNKGKALSLIDLDTVGPGLILQDIGDCLRSSCNPKGENYLERQAACDVELVAGTVSGYFSRKIPSPFELEHIHTSLYLITFELGLRFLTDHLQGDRYFKVQNREDNLRRALGQFQLVDSILRQERVLRKRIADAFQQYT